MQVSITWFELLEFSLKLHNRRGARHIGDTQKCSVGSKADIQQQLRQPPSRRDIILQACRQLKVAKALWQALSQRLPCPRVLAQPQIAPHNMLEQPHTALIL